MCAGKHGDGPHLVRVVRYLTVVMPVSANQMSQQLGVSAIRLGTRHAVSFPVPGGVEYFV